MESRLEYIREKTVDIDRMKNEFARLKINGENSESLSRDISTGLIYVIAELRKVAGELGVGDDGKIPAGVTLPKLFVGLNGDIKELKREVLWLLNATPVQVLDEYRSRLESANIGAPKSTGDSKTRERLREKLKEKSNRE
jgi:hypothetical protein